MKSAKQTLQKEAAQVTLVQPLNHNKIVWDAVNMPDDMAHGWFEAEAGRWADRSGQHITSSRGVLARWLYFFSLFMGSAAIIRSRYGQYMKEA